MRAREIMSHPAVTVTAGTSIADAAQLLADKGFTALPVTDDDGQLVGIVTEADLISDRIAADPRIHGLEPTVAAPRRPETVTDVMTTAVESLTPGADVADAARMMVVENIRCFPIVDGRAIVGVITRRDLLRAAVAHPDSELESAVAAQLTRLDDSGRFSVRVQAGVAEIEDFRDSDDDRRLAEQIAARVPGIVAAQATHRTIDPF